MKRVRKITKLPERSEDYGKHGCSGPRCRRRVQFIASYPHQAGVQADRLYCREHAERFARRYGLRGPR